MDLPVPVAGDTAWMLVATALVLVMAPGIGFFYGGLVGRKNAVSVVIQSILVMCLVGTLWPLIGYSLAFAPGMLGGLVGNFDYAALENVSQGRHGRVPGLLSVVYECTFAIIAAALVIGGFAERMRLSAFMIFIPAWILLVYCPIAHWIWGSSGAGSLFSLQDIGVLDFAGGMVVHLNAGIAALVAGLIIGRRPGFPSSMAPPHNLNFCLLGVGLLWFGWIGFNAGSAGAANRVATYALANTVFAASAAGLAWLVLERIFLARVTGVGLVSGIVAGLVAITPGSGYVEPMASLVIGAGASALSFPMTRVLAGRFELDDSLDVFSVHGVSALWGALATGLFATLAVNAEGANGLFYGNPGQLWLQLRGVLQSVLWCALLSYLILKALDLTLGVRADPEDEELGLDAAHFAVEDSEASARHS